MYNLLQFNFALAATSAMPLKAYIPKVRSDNKLMREYGQDGVRNFGLLMTQFAINLVGPVDNPTVMTGEVTNEDYFRATFVSMEHLLLIGWLNNCCLQLAYYFEDYDRADACSRKTDDFAQVAGGHPYVYRHAFFSSLTAFVMARKEGAGRRQRMGQWRRAVRYARQVQKWSEAGNVNCLHLTQLLEAERLSFFSSKVLDAKRMYNSAITTANKNGYLNDKALAHERAFFFHRTLATTNTNKMRRSPPLSPGSPAPSPPPSTGSGGASSPPLALSDSNAGGNGGDDDWFWALHHYKDSIEAYCDWNAYQKAKHLVDAHGDQFKLTASAFTSLSAPPEAEDSDVSPWT